MLFANWNGQSTLSPSLQVHHFPEGRTPCRDERHGVHLLDHRSVGIVDDVATCVAEGEATHLGHFTVTGEYLVDVTDGTATGTFTITVANGDKLFISSIGHALQPPSLKETVEEVTVTGGTGRFKGATGSWFMDAHFDFVFGGPELTDPYVATLEGIISTPGASKK